MCSLTVIGTLAFAAISAAEDSPSKVLDPPAGGHSYDCLAPGAVLLVLLATLVPQNGLAEPASDSQMAEEALIPFASKDPERSRRTLNWHFRKLVDLDAQAPEEIRPATVFFNRGLSIRELYNLQVRLGVEVMDVVMKAPEGDDGQVMSVMTGMDDLFAIEGTLEERLSFVMSVQQKCFARFAQLMPPEEAEEAKEMADLASARFHVYSARIFGPNRSLRELLDQPDVTTVLLNLRPDVISSFEAARSYDGPRRLLMPGFEC